MPGLTARITAAVLYDFVFMEGGSRIVTIDNGCGQKMEIDSSVLEDIFGYVAEIKEDYICSYCFASHGSHTPSCVVAQEASNTEIIEED